MDTSEGSTDGHKEMETNDAGKYFKRPGMEEKGEIGYQHNNYNKVCVICYMYHTCKAT